MTTIANIVKTQQSTGDKLSSSVDFRILDELLIRALGPLERETRVYKEWLAELVAFFVTSRRRQNDELMDACLYGLRGNISARYVVESGIDREMVFSFLDRATKLGAMLEQSQLSWIRRRANRTDNASLQIIADVKAQMGEGPLVCAAAR